MYYNPYEEDKKMKELIEKKYFSEQQLKTLNHLLNERVFSIGFNDLNRYFYISEECDEYFATELTSEICNDLAAVFSKLGKYIGSEKRNKK